MPKYTKAQIENIKSYTDDIKTLATFAEGVRKTLGQFVGYTGAKGWLNASRELIQNLLDEINDPESIGDCGWVEFDENTQRIYVRDNGRGIPLNDIVRVYTSQFTSKNYEKEKGNYSSGRHGVGSKATNALSSRFEVISHVLGKCRHVVFIDGALDYDSGIKKDDSGLQGTEVWAFPHPVMENPDLKAATVVELLEAIIPLYKVGTKIEFKGVEKSGKELSQVIVNQDGLLTYLVRKTTDPLIVPVIMSGDTGTIKAEIAFTYDATTPADADIDSFANFCPTTGGTHVDGFLNGLCSYFRKYMNEVYLNTGKKTDNKKKKKELKILPSDIKCGLKAVVHGLHLYPTFTGQAKEQLSNEDVKKYFEQMVPAWLDEWATKSPKDFIALCKYFEQVAKIRMDSDKAKEKLAANYKANRLTNMPAKYIPPNDLNSDQLELIIVEGDSAYGSYKNSRNANTQGLFPIRGKFLNVLGASIDKIRANEEIQALNVIIGGNGIGKAFDITRVRWRRIIIAADADIDGYHIRTLLMKFFLFYMTDLVLDGRVYIAIPPLYGLHIGSKMKYFTNDAEYVRYVQGSFVKKFDINYADGTHVSNGDLFKILYDNAKYVAEMDRVAYATNPHFLEYLLSIRNNTPKKIEQLLKKRYRFLQSVVVKGNTIVVTALVDKKINTVFLDPRFYMTCDKVLNYIDKGYMEFEVNGEKTGLYGLMKTYDRFSPEVVRYKGLGEMNEDQLAESTLYPSPTRKLMQYSIDDLDKDLNEVRALETNRSVLLKSIKG